MKKSVPISIRKILEKVLDDNPSLIRAVPDDKSVVIFKEKYDFDSSFYFKLESINVTQNGRTIYTIEYLPSNNENLKPKRHSTNSEELNTDIKTWIDLLIEYNKESIIFDDKITQKYYEDLEPQFTIIDKDADFAPHSFEQQEQLQKYLDFARHKIEVQVTSENQVEAEEIIKEIIEAKDVISKSTKTENISRIRKIIAKAHKMKYEIGKELLIEFLSDAAKWIGSAAIGALLG